MIVDRVSNHTVAPLPDGRGSWRTLWHCLAAAVGMVLWIQAAGAASWGEAVSLARQGQARMPVVIAAQADEAVREAAGELADYLGRITGATFAVEHGDSSRGIVVGLPGDFADLPFDPGFQQGFMHGEDYLLRSHAGGLWVLGNTSRAVSHAVWDLLYRMGYRQYFPGDTWEIIPDDPNLQIAVDVFEHPDFWSRVFPSFTSRGRDAYGDRTHYHAWMKRNRVSPQSLMPATHAYGFIIRRNREQFDAHPEYLALVDGERKGSKFCISNPGLRQLVIDDSLQLLQSDPDRLAVSMDPSDGGNWCQCEPCEQIGSVTNRVVTLANAVAEAIPEDRYVRINAYNYHSPPPTIRVHPRVTISVTAGHLTGNWQPQDLFDAWAAMGGAPFAGVFEYYSNIVSNNWLPQGQRASDLVYLATSIPDFHRRGARLIGSGMAYSNGAVSLGAFVAARLAWDISQADQVTELYEDFLTRTFGSAQEPMDRFYRQVYVVDPKSPRMPLTSDKIGRMYRALNDALAVTSEPAVVRRIMDLVAYTRYVEIYLDFERTQGNARVEAYGDVVRYAYRIRDKMLVNTAGLFSFPRRVDWPDNARWRTPEAENPWKDPTPVTDEELRQSLRLGIENNPVGDYEMRWFSEQLVFPTGLGFDDQPAQIEVDRNNQPLYVMEVRGNQQVFYTWVDQSPAMIELQVRSGLIEHYRHRMGPVRITLYSDQAVSDEADFVVTEDQSVQPDGELFHVSLPTRYTGLHRIEVQDGGAGTQVFPGRDDMAFTVDLGPTRTVNFRRPWTGYFYVPKGTKELSFHVNRPAGNSQIRDSRGHVVFRFPGRNDPPTEQNERLRQAGYLNVSVPPGEDGKVWQIYRAARSQQWRLMNVPPYLAPRPSQLLLPREVVEADRP